MKHVVIIGSGMAGLGAAWFLKNKQFKVTILEKENVIGGLCRTEKQNGYSFDYTGHLLHFKNSLFKKIVFDLMTDNLYEKKRSAWIYSKNTFTKYPFQMNLYGLPDEIIVECVYQYCIKFFKNANRHSNNYEKWIRNNFGNGIAEHFLIPYNEKLFKRKVTKLHKDTGGRFIPKVDIKDVISGAIKSDDKSVGYNTTFYYPIEGGIMDLINRLASGIEIEVNKNVEEINVKGSRVITERNEIKYDYLISTMPLPDLIEKVKDVELLNDHQDKLKYISILNVNFGIKKENANKHWVYIPEKKYDFHRVGFFNNFSEKMVPPGKSSIFYEISYKKNDIVNTQKVIDKCINDSLEIGLINSAEDIDLIKVIKIPFGYVVCNNQRKKYQNSITKELNKTNIRTAGRFGSWEYFSMEDSFMDGYYKAKDLVS
jgi:protoporphyrinogen oxidase